MQSVHHHHHYIIIDNLMMDVEGPDCKPPSNNWNIAYMSLPSHQKYPTWYSIRMTCCEVRIEESNDFPMMM